jgi:hypothetical protein
MADFVVPANVRDYLQATGLTGQWSNAIIGSNIAAASGNLQRWTGRQFEPQGSNLAVTKRFTTNGQAYMVLPGLVSASSVTLQGTTLEADTTYWLIPDRLNTGVHTAIQLRAFGRYDYRSNPEWFDRNLDHPRWFGSTLPNDLAIAGHWGHFPYPPELMHATTVLAGYYTLRSDALLAGTVNRLEQGVIFDLSQLPIEVQNFVDQWRLREQAVAI